MPWLLPSFYFSRSERKPWRLEGKQAYRPGYAAGAGRLALDMGGIARQSVRLIFVSLLFHVVASPPNFPKTDILPQNLNAQKTEKQVGRHAIDGGRGIHYVSPEKAFLLFKLEEDLYKPPV